MTSSYDQEPDHTLLSLKSVVSGHKELLTLFEHYNPTELAATFSALLTSPELQSNCLRLELLVHLSLSYAHGKRQPTSALIAKAFASLGKGVCGQYEDPSESVFVEDVLTSHGTFRLLGGVWESGAFYLQRIINVVETMPDIGEFSQIRKSVYALLKLSDLLCEKSKLSRHQLGNTNPQKLLPKKIASATSSLRSLVKFSISELDAAQISLENLSSFIIDQRNFSALQKEIYGNTTLERHPIALCDGGIAVLLPSALSATIRRYVVEFAKSRGLSETFTVALAEEYAELFSNTPLLGGRIGAPIEFRRTDKSLLAGATTRVDTGRYLNFVFSVDTLKGFEGSGLVSENPDIQSVADDVDKWIDYAVTTARAQPDFQSGTTLLVDCGIGRTSLPTLNPLSRSCWRNEFISAPDLFTLSLTPNFQPLSLWRILDTQEHLHTQNVELLNINGLLNMAAWSRELKGHLVPHSSLPPDFGKGEELSLIVVNPTSIRTLRHEVATFWDRQAVKGTSGRWRNVRKYGESVFDEDLRQPFYVAEEKDGSRWLPSVYITEKHNWWCEVEVDEGTSGHDAYERWKMLSGWLSKLAPILDDALPELPRTPLLLIGNFKGTIGKFPNKVTPLSFDEAKAQIDIFCEPQKKTLTLTIRENFQLAAFNSDNVAEKALVSKIIEGFHKLAEKTFTEIDEENLLRAAVPDNSARYMHAFRARDFRDFVRESIPRSVTFIDVHDDALLKLGLGWRARDRKLGSKVVGKSECTSFLNRVVRLLEDELCAELHKYDRRKTVARAIGNHECAAVDRALWKRTAGAVLSLHQDKPATMEAIANHNFKLNTVSHTTRVLAEVALCECPIEGGLTPGKLDISRLLAKANLISGLGGWSDAIRWDAMEPMIKVTPLGDIHANPAFQESIIEPFGRAGSKVQIENAIKQYPKNFEEIDVIKSAEGAFEDEFLSAWKEQFGASLDDVRIFADFTENLGMRSKRAIFSTRLSALLTAEINGEKVDSTANASIVEFLMLKPRATWRDIPAGYDERDRQPWRFRRQLSILRRPLIQIDESSDPEILVAPGILRESLAYMLANYHRGDFPRWQLTKGMLSWAGKSRNHIGKQFGFEVAARLKENGWIVETEVRITKLLRKSFDKDYGDVDVLAWNPQIKRVLIIECKDVHFRKTYGEIAEQLSDFRGEIKSDGKPDLLLRHLNRVDVLSKHLLQISAYLKIPHQDKVESHLVFKNPDPMQFALERLSKSVALHTFEDLHGI